MTDAGTPDALYVHIPFCARRCAYCSFFSTTLHDDKTVEAYLCAVTDELRIRMRTVPLRPKTIYIGGGTPSCVPSDIFALFTTTLRDALFLDNLYEYTVEMNPESVCPAFIRAARTITQPRVSLGVQTFNEKALATIGRKGGIGAVERAVSLLRTEGVENISLDFIIGLPHTTRASTLLDVTRALSSFTPAHVSLYFLDLSGKGERAREWDALLPSEEDVVATYHDICDVLREAGFEHYEVANFALPGMRSRHNEAYWKGRGYVGVGAGAFGCFGDVRYGNVLDVMAYIKGVDEGTLLATYDALGRHERKKEFIFLSLRRKEGIDTRAYEARFDELFPAGAYDALSPYDGYILCDDGRIALTEAGFLFADEIAVALFGAIGDS